MLRATSGHKPVLSRWQHNDPYEPNTAPPPIPPSMPALSAVQASVQGLPGSGGLPSAPPPGASLNDELELQVRSMVTASRSEASRLEERIGQLQRENQTLQTKAEQATRVAEEARARTSLEVMQAAQQAQDAALVRAEQDKAHALTQASGSARAELDQALAITLAKAAAERDKAVSDAVRERSEAMERALAAERREQEARLQQVKQ